jgi:hypothetical protein
LQVIGILAPLAGVLRSATGERPTMNVLDAEAAKSTEGCRHRLANIAPEGTVYVFRFADPANPFGIFLSKQTAIGLSDQARTRAWVQPIPLIQSRSSE